MNITCGSSLVTGDMLVVPCENEWFTEAPNVREVLKSMYALWLDGVSFLLILLYFVG